MKYLAKLICDKILFRNNENNEKNIYIVEHIIFNLLVALILVMYSILFEKVIGTLIISLSFIIFDFVISGYKLKHNYSKIGVLILILFINEIIPQDEISNTFAFWSSIICLFPIILLSPGNYVNTYFIKLNNKTNKLIFNIISILLTVILLFISMFNRLYKLNLIYLSSVGIPLVICTILLIIESINKYMHNKF